MEASSCGDVCHGPNAVDNKPLSFGAIFHHWYDTIVLLCNMKISAGDPQIVKVKHLKNGTNQSLNKY